MVCNDEKNVQEFREWFLSLDDRMKSFVLMSLACSITAHCFRWAMDICLIKNGDEKKESWKNEKSAFYQVERALL